MFPSGTKLYSHVFPMFQGNIVFPTFQGNIHNFLHALFFSRLSFSVHTEATILLSVLSSLVFSTHRGNDLTLCSQFLSSQYTQRQRSHSLFSAPYIVFSAHRGSDLNLCSQLHIQFPVHTEATISLSVLSSLVFSAHRSNDLDLCSQLLSSFVFLI